MNSAASSNYRRAAQALKDALLSRGPQAVHVALLGLAVAHILLYLTVALARLSYPYELEWIEGGMLEHVRRVVEGQALYVEPSLEFTPLIYPPAYYVASAAMARVAGLGLPALRLVSLLASLGSLAVVGVLVRRETSQTRYGLLAAGLLAATYQASGTWFDTARVDSLFLLLFLLGVYLLRGAPRWWTSVGAAALLALSFLTKQTALGPALPFVIYYLVIRPPRRRALFSAVFVLAVAGSALGLSWASGGWFTYYVFDLPRQHVFDLHTLYDRISGGEWLLGIPVATVVAVGSLVYLWRRRRDRFAYHALLLGGLCLPTYVYALRSGSFRNVYMPAHAAVAVLFGIGLHALVTYLRSAPRAADELSLRAAGKVVASCSFRTAETLVCLACALQLAVMFYNPAALVPSEEDLRAGNELVSRLRAVDGEVLVPFHGYLAALAGKQASAHEMALGDVFRGNDREVQARLNEGIEAAIIGRRFKAIVVDTNRWFMRLVVEHYTYKGPVFASDDVFWPVTGRKVRPERWFVPRER